MQLSTVFITLLTSVLAVVAVPGPVAGIQEDARDLVKRETSYGNPDLVVDQGNRWKANYGSTDGHSNACPGHYICYIPKNGAHHDDVDFGDPDDFVDEGDRWRFNYGSTDGHPNACPGHYICYVSK